MKKLVMRCMLVFALLSPATQTSALLEVVSYPAIFVGSLVKIVNLFPPDLARAEKKLAALGAKVVVNGDTVTIKTDDGSAPNLQLRLVANEYKKAYSNATKTSHIANLLVMFGVGIELIAQYS